MKCPQDARISDQEIEEIDNRNILKVNKLRDELNGLLLTEICFLQTQFTQNNLKTKIITEENPLELKKIYYEFKKLMSEMVYLRRQYMYHQKHIHEIDIVSKKFQEVKHQQSYIQQLRQKNDKMCEITSLKDEMLHNNISQLSSVEDNQSMEQEINITKEYTPEEMKNNGYFSKYLLLNRTSLDDKKKFIYLSTLLLLFGIFLMFTAIFLS